MRCILVKHGIPPHPAQERMLAGRTSLGPGKGLLLALSWVRAQPRPVPPAAAAGRSNLSTLYLSAFWSGDLIGFDRPWIPFQSGQTLHFKLKT